MSLQMLDIYRPTRREHRSFYTSTAWREARLLALARLGRCCCRCGSRRRIVVDHIVPVRVSWEARLDQRNLQILCADCHNGPKKREERTW